MGSISSAQACKMYYFSNTNELLQKSNYYSNEAKNLQQDLTTLGYSTNGIDGYFGNNTRSAVLRFQRDYGLSQDGIVGNQTKSAIAAAQSSKSTSTSNINSNLLKIGMSGAKVSALQVYLNSLGYNTNGVDGQFGQNTKNAVVAFQKAHGLSQDGIVGGQTINSIATALGNANNKNRSIDMSDSIVSASLTSGVISSMDKSLL